MSLNKQKKEKMLNDSSLHKRIMKMNECICWKLLISYSEEFEIMKLRFRAEEANKIIQQSIMKS